MTDEFIWLVIGKVLVTASPLAFFAVVTYLILRDSFKETDDEEEVVSTPRPSDPDGLHNERKADR